MSLVGDFIMQTRGRSGRERSERAGTKASHRSVSGHRNRSKISLSVACGHGNGTFV